MHQFSHHKSKLIYLKQHFFVLNKVSQVLFVSLVLCKATIAYLAYLSWEIYAIKKNCLILLMKKTLLLQVSCRFIFFQKKIQTLSWWTLKNALDETFWCSWEIFLLEKIRSIFFFFSEKNPSGWWNKTMRICRIYWRQTLRVLESNLKQTENLLVPFNIFYEMRSWTSNLWGDFQKINCENADFKQKKKIVIFSYSRCHQSWIKRQKSREVKHLGQSQGWEN